MENTWEKRWIDKAITCLRSFLSNNDTPETRQQALDLLVTHAGIVGIRITLCEGVNVSSDCYKQIVDCLVDRNKIKAIDVLRKSIGQPMKLKIAKELVEDIAEKEGIKGIKLPQN